MTHQNYSTREPMYATLGAPSVGGILLNSDVNSVRTGTAFLNPHLFLANLSPGYMREESGLFVDKGDPRNFDTRRGIENQFSSPPMTGSIKRSEIYSSPKLSGYQAGKTYNGYGSISAGQIVYRIDKAIQDPFYKPVFPQKLKSIGYQYTDPMGVKKPQYVSVQNWGGNPLSTPLSAGSESSTFARDTNNHRSDIISAQMRKYNQSRYEVQYGN